MVEKVETYGFGFPVVVDWKLDGTLTTRLATSLFFF